MYCKLSVFVLASLTSCGGQSAASHTTPPTNEPSVARSADETSRELVTAFHQNEFGNCTSIGFIKAALHAYQDPGGMFLRVVSRDDGGATIVTKDQVTFEVSVSELATTAQKAGLKYASDAQKQRWERSVNLLYATLARSCQVDCTSARKYCTPTRRRSCDSFDAALDYLDHGLKWSAPPRLLGLKEGVDFSVLKGWRGRRWVRIVGFVSGGRSCVAATPWHTFFVSEKIFDLYGNVETFSKTASRKALFANHAYCLHETDRTTAVLEDTDQADIAHVVPSPASPSPPSIDVEGDN